MFQELSCHQGNGEVSVIYTRSHSQPGSMPEIGSAPPTWRSRVHGEYPEAMEAGPSSEQRSRQSDSHLEVHKCYSEKQKKLASHTQSSLNQGEGMRKCYFFL